MPVLNSLHPWSFFMIFSRLLTLYRVSNSLDPDQNKHYVGPDPGQNCMHRLSEVMDRNYFMVHLHKSIRLGCD